MKEIENVIPIPRIHVHFRPEKKIVYKKRGFSQSGSECHFVILGLSELSYRFREQVR